MAKFNFGRASNGSRRATGVDGSNPDGSAEFDPADFVNPDNAASGDGGRGDDADGNGVAVIRKRRGRPPGSGRGKSSGSGTAATGKAKVSASVSGIEKTLLSIHSIVATITSTPELALEDEEARAIAEAVARVSEHYSIPGLDEGPASIAMLVGTLFAIYGKRFIILRGKKAKVNTNTISKNGAKENDAPQFPMDSIPGSMFGLGTT